MGRLSGLVTVVATLGALVLCGCSADVGGTPQAAANGPGATTSAADPSATGPTSGTAMPSLSIPVGATSSSSSVPPVARSTSGPAPATTGEPPTSASPPTTSDPAATTSVAAAAPTTANGGTAPWQRSDGDAWFQTPDGSVRCAVGPSQGDGRPLAICRVSGHTYSVPKAPSGSCANWGDYIVLAPTGADFECYTDDRFDTAATVLPANSTLRFAGFTCQVGTVSTVCQYDSTTQAFTVNTKDYQFWSTATPSTTSKPPATTTKASTPQPATVDGHASPWNSGSGWAAFQSPSGNISCMVGDISGGSTQAMCEIKNHTYATPTSTSCTLDYGDRFVLGTSGKATLGCHGDTIADDSAAVLPYGTSITWGPLACTSSESGIWCGDQDTGHHFKVASAAYELG